MSATPASSYRDSPPGDEDENSNASDHQSTALDPPEEGGYYDSDSSSYGSPPRNYEMGDIRYSSPDRGSRAVSPPAPAKQRMRSLADRLEGAGGTPSTSEACDVEKGRLRAPGNPGCQDESTGEERLQSLRTSQRGSRKRRLRRILKLELETITGLAKRSP